MLGLGLFGTTSSGSAAVLTGVEATAEVGILDEFSEDDFATLTGIEATAEVGTVSGRSTQWVELDGPSGNWQEI